MIDRVIEFSIRNRTLVILAGFLLAAWGVLAIYQTPVDAIPDLSENQVIVFTDWMGHSPREIEDQLTYPLSVNLQGLAGVRVVRSSSDFNFSMISVIFEDSVNVAAARQRVTERLTRLSTLLPDGVTPQIGPETPATGQIFWYTVEGAGYDLGRLRAIQDWYVRYQLSAVPGVAEVASVGGRPIEFQIEVDPNRLRAFGVTLNDVVHAVGRSNTTVGGHVVQKANAEYIVRGIGWLGTAADSGDGDEPGQILRDIEQIVVRPQIRPPAIALSQFPRISDVAVVTIGSQPRRGVLEKDGQEVTGGVVLMRYGENPLEVTRRLKEKIEQLQAGLPPGVRIVTCYDRTPLIHGAIGTVTGTLTEAILTATACVLIVLLHFRTSFIIAVTLPLATLASFVLMWLLRQLGIADIQTNIMSLAGIAISIGVLVDSSIVMAENVMHHLKREFGDQAVRGDTRAIVFQACRTVGRPIFFSVLIMLISFIPVFALGGMEGKMFRPLAFTKSFALLAVAVLSITLVPALCTIFIKGRLRAETDSWVVRSFVEVYRPVLSYLLERPAPLLWILSVTFIVGLAPLGIRWVFLGAVFLAIVATGMATRGGGARAAVIISLVVVALVADQTIKPLGREFMTPLDEGIIMDMPITVPRASVTQSADDLMARDMVLCRFPEIDMVMGKAGRAETATDPAPMDMIESMVSFRPPELWPKRRLRAADAERQTRAVLTALVGKQLIEPPPDRSAFDALVSDATSAAQSSFDAVMREVAWHKNEEFGERLGRQPTQHRALWRGHLEKLNDELLDRAPATYTRLVTDELLARATVTDAKLDAILEEQRRQRQQPATTRTVRAGHHGSRPAVPVVMPDPHPVLDSLRIELAEKFRRWLILWPQDRAELIGFGGELDRALQMPGWTNVWTMPIQNRVDMLATGVNTAIGVRLLGRDLDDVVRASEDVAAELRLIPGAADVVADPIRGKGYLEIRPDRTRIAHYGLNVADVNEVVETAVAGKVATTTVQGRERHPVRVRLTRDWREDEETVRNLLVPVEEIRTNLDQLTGVELGADPVDEVASPLSPVIPLSEIADVRITEGPATIKSENGLLRNYVRLNVRGRGVVDFVEEARRVVAQKVKLPAGVYLEWTGQFEHHVRARNRLVLLVPLVIGLILLILYLTYRDWADAVLMLLTVPGAMVGGVLFQWLFGFKFSVTVWVGYIACFGMATATGIIMLVYLREAIEKAGGLAHITLDELRQAVLNGAVQRLRPKLLTEGTTMIGLAPMLWATGTGAEVIRPMAAPVLGGILVADEVIDLLLPVLFYWVRHWRWLQLHTKPLGLMDDGQEPLRVLPEQRAMPAVAGLPTDQTSSIVLDIGNQPEFG